MAEVNPTTNWVRPLINVPGYGIVRKPRMGVLHLPDHVANYLGRLGLVTGEGIDDGVPTATALLPVPEVTETVAIEGDTEPVVDNDTTSTTETESLTPEPDESEARELLLEFLNASDAEQISDKINGVGLKSATHLKESKPDGELTWADVLTIFSERQIKSAIQMITN